MNITIFCHESSLNYEAATKPSETKTLGYAKKHYTIFKLFQEINCTLQHS